MEIQLTKRFERDYEANDFCEHLEAEGIHPAKIDDSRGKFLPQVSVEIDLINPEETIAAFLSFQREGSSNG